MSNLAQNIDTRPSISAAPAAPRRAREPKLTLARLESYASCPAEHIDHVRENLDTIHQACAALLLLAENSDRKRARALWDEIREAFSDAREWLAFATLDLSEEELRSYFGCDAEPAENAPESGTSPMGEG